MNNSRNQFSIREVAKACRAALVCGLLLIPAGVNAQTQMRSFSADQVHVVGKKTSTGKIYSSDKGVRIESDEKGKPSITIMRLDQKAVWVLNPEAKTYVDMAGIGAMGAEMATAAKGAKVDKQLLGSEQVGAYHCDKYHVEATLEGKVYKSIEWDAKELDGFPVKQSDEKGSWSKEYQNVKLGPQDPSLFEVPSDYKKIDLGLGGIFRPH